MTALPMTIATPSDAADIAALRDRLAHWLNEQGVDQWQQGEVTAATIADDAALGLWHILRDACGELEAAIRISFSDPDFWGEDDAPAGYIHGLMVAPTRRGEGLGTRLLDYAVGVIGAAGKPRVRLDTATSNPVLMAYYPRHGFTAVRDAKLPPSFGRDFAITLFERSI